MPQYLSTDPNAGQDYLSTDPSEGEARAAQTKSVSGFIENAASDVVNNVVIGTLKSLWPGNWPEMARAMWDERGRQRADAQQEWAQFEAAVQANGVPVPSAREALANLSGHATSAASAVYEQPVSTALTFAGPALMRPRPPAPPRRMPVFPRNPNMVTRAAVEFAEREGIPLDAATATGNRFVSGVQKLTDETLGGSLVGGKSRGIQSNALNRVANRLAERTHPTPVLPEQAGTGVQKAVSGVVSAEHQAANTAYSTVRSLDMPVDITGAKAGLRPVYDRLMRENSIVPLQGGKAKALIALDRIMEAPDSAPLSVVDAALSDLKTIARVDMPDLRTPGQGIAAKGVRQLEAQVRAATIGNPPVQKALSAGRAATRAKYAAADVLDSLNAEPRRIFDQLTAGKDTAINQLRAVQQIAPTEMPKIGRAVIEEAIKKATAEGGFGRSAGLLTDWQRLGPETKRILFGSKQHVNDLDSFFILSKRIADNPNPSGTALTAMKGAELGLWVTNPLAAVSTTSGAAMLSAMLHSPRVARVLVHGLRVPRLSPAAKTSAVAQLVRVAREEGIHMVPAVAEDPAHDEPPRERPR